MNSAFVYLTVGIGLWLIGLLGLLLAKHMLRRIIAINLMGSGVFLVLVALATRTEPADAVLHALVVTGLVVAVSATAFALRLANAQSHKHSYPREHLHQPKPTQEDFPGDGPR